MSITSKLEFVLPKHLNIDEDVLTDNYGRFVIEPLEKTLGHTLGNGLRRILMSTLGSIAISWVKIDGVSHEFDALDYVVEDISDIALNFKKVRIKGEPTDVNFNLTLEVKKVGPVYAKDIKVQGDLEIANPDLLICTLDKPKLFSAEIGLKYGRGYADATENKPSGAPIGLIPIDTVYTPVERVSYEVEATRVGRVTDYEKIVLDVWTDGRISPKDAVDASVKILMDHLKVLANFDNQEDNLQINNAEDETLLHKMLMNVNSIKLSVRALNCLEGANIRYVGELIQQIEAEMLKFRNFGKKSLTEIKEKLLLLGLSLNMNVKEEILSAFEKSLVRLESKE